MVGDAVLVCDYRRGEKKWILRLVASQEGPVSYTVDMGSGVQWGRHAEQMWVSYQTLYSNLEQPAVLNISGRVFQQDSSSSSPVREEALPTGTVDSEQEAASTTENPEDVGRRYPRQVTKPPDQFSL